MSAFELNVLSGIIGLYLIIEGSVYDSKLTAKISTTARSYLETEYYAPKRLIINTVYGGSCTALFIINMFTIAN